MTTIRRSAILLVLAVCATGAAADEAYPARPITIVNPFPPGGIADLTARPLAPALERVLE
jgi:tripartite-type tricarboxylate transporter receptor subunit TctC